MVWTLRLTVYTVGFLTSLLRLRFLTIIEITLLVGVQLAIPTNIAFSPW